MRGVLYAPILRTQDTAMTNPTHVSLAEAAARLSVNPKTLRRMIARGELPAYRVGARLIRIEVAALEAVGRRLAVAA